MNQRVRAVAIVLLVAAALGLALHGLRGGGPVYHGRSTADWVRRALRENPPGEATTAVLHIGAPAVPYISRHGLHDISHTFQFLTYDRVTFFVARHPLLGHWLRLNSWESCVPRHYDARALLVRMGTNGQAAIPDVIDCLEHCPSGSYMELMDSLSTLGEISGTNAAAIPYLTRRARGNDSVSFRAAAMVYRLNGQTNLLVELCQRLARTDPGELLLAQDLYWLRGEHEFNQHLVPLLEAICADQRTSASDREIAMEELELRGDGAPAAITRLLTRPTNGLVPAQ